MKIYDRKKYQKLVLDKSKILKLLALPDGNYKKCEFMVTRDMKLDDYIATQIDTLIGNDYDHDYFKKGFSLIKDNAYRVMLQNMLISYDSSQCGDEKNDKDMYGIHYSFSVDNMYNFYLDYELIMKDNPTIHSSVKFYVVTLNTDNEIVNLATDEESYERIYLKADDYNALIWNDICKAIGIKYGASSIVINSINMTINRMG